MKQAVLSLSGGMDSSTLLLHLLANDYKVTALSFDYGQKHRVELERAQELVNYLNSKADETLAKNDLGETIMHHFEKITYQTIKLDGLSTLLNSALVEGGDEVPEGHYENDNMKATVVPNRNKIFSSITQAVALSIALKSDGDEKVKIAMGIHAGDHEIYPDCRQSFRDIDYKAFWEGNWDANKVIPYTPYLDGDKYDILVDGEKCCNDLGIDFDEVYKRTNTSYKPIQHPTGNNTLKYDTDFIPTETEYKWYSDYKSASSVERIEAFIQLGRPDPVEYADETGPVDWETVKQHAEQLLYDWAADKGRD
jgi:7-cyano-7-deazaguanine synthase